MDWKESISAWLVENTGYLAMIWTIVAGAIGLLGRYCIRTSRALRAKNIFQIIWNVTMLAITATGFAYFIRWLHSSPNPDTMTVLAISLFLCAMFLAPAYLYINKWNDDLQDMMWWPLVPASSLLLLIHAFPYFVLSILFFVVMYLVGTSKSYSDSMAVRDYLIDRARRHRSRR